MIYRQKWIERDDLKNNPDVFFLFGDNVKREGFGGQAASMRGEPNALGVATKWEPNNKPESFFYDNDFDRVSRIISTDMRSVFRARDAGHMIVLPADGLGTGLATLDKCAPRINNHLLWLLDVLERGGQPAWKTLLNGGNDEIQPKVEQR